MILYYLVDQGTDRDPRAIMVPVGYPSHEAASAERDGMLDIYPPTDTWHTRLLVEALDSDSEFVRKTMSKGKRAGAAGKIRHESCRIPLKGSGIRSMPVETVAAP